MYKNKYKNKITAFFLIVLLAAPLISACAGPADNVLPVIKNIEPEESVKPAEQEASAGKQENPAPEQEASAAEQETPAGEQETPAGEPEAQTPQQDGTDRTAEENDTVVTSGILGPEVTTITISAVGDVILGNYWGQEYGWSFFEMYDKMPDKGYFFENVYNIFSEDDMTIANMEGVLTLSEDPVPDRTYNMYGYPEYANILTLGSVEAVSMANNHRLDFGEEGSRDTQEALDQEGIVYAYDKKVGIYETKGIRIGFVSVNEASWGKGVERPMKDGIEKLREEGADLILACCHWGTEREYFPEEYQQELGRMCIDWGADLVIGHHPHVLQGVEEYQGKYIVYSLGNFCFGGNRNPADKDTMIVQQTFTFVEGEKQEATVFRIIPCSVSSVKNRNDYRPTPAEGDEAWRIIERVNEFSRDLGMEFDRAGYPAGGSAP